MIVSIIVPDDTLKKVIERDLVGIESEVIIADWNKGFKEATGQFICFMEKGSDYRGGLFIRGLLNMLIKPAYRKLSMVSPAVEELGGDRTVFGYKCTGGFAALTESCLVIHPVQIGYIPGAMIRRSALEDQEWNFNSPILQLSTDFSLHMWEVGHRVHVDPQMIYIVDRTDNHLKKLPMPSDKVKLAWKQESI